MKNKVLIIIAGISFSFAWLHYLTSPVDSLLSFDSPPSFERLDKEAFEQATYFYKKYGSFNSWKKAKKRSFTQQFKKCAKENKPLFIDPKSKHVFFRGIPYEMFKSLCDDYNAKPDKNLKNKILKQWPIVKSLCKKVNFCFSDKIFTPLAIIHISKKGIIVIPSQIKGTTITINTINKVINLGILLHELGHIHCGHSGLLHHYDKKTKHLEEHEADWFSYTYSSKAAETLCHFLYCCDEQENETHPSCRERYKNSKIAVYMWEFERQKLLLSEQVRYNICF